MDLLTHLFLPVTVAYAVYERVFERPLTLALAGFAVLPDADKLLGSPGLLHSLVTLVPVAAVVLGGASLLDVPRPVAVVAVALLGSHLVLDVVDGGPVPLLYPFVKAGIGLTYPAEIVFEGGPVGVGVRGPLVALANSTADPERTAYPLIHGYGVLSALVFVTVYGVGEWPRVGGGGGA